MLGAGHLPGGTEIALVECLQYREIARFPHDPGAFTQGLIYLDGVFFESTGQYGESRLRRVDPVSGAVLQETWLPDHWFGEGIVEWEDLIVQLTWREGLGLVYRRETLERIDQFALAGEGWGLTQDGRQWILSDGSDRLTYLDPSTRRPVRVLPVRYQGRPVRGLNELEFARDVIWANVWWRDEILRIAPETGAVTGILDLSTLYPSHRRPRGADVLNGIAYDPERDAFFVTGKYWPWMFLIEVRDTGRDCQWSVGR